MKSKIVHLDNTAAIAVPQSLLDECHLAGEVEIEAQGQCLVVRAPGTARDRWDEAFANRRNEANRLLLRDLPPSRWDEEEWEW